MLPKDTKDLATIHIAGGAKTAITQSKNLVQELLLNFHKHLHPSKYTASD